MPGDSDQGPAGVCHRAKLHRGVTETPFSSLSLSAADLGSEQRRKKCRWQDMGAKRYLSRVGRKQIQRTRVYSFSPSGWQQIAKDLATSKRWHGGEEVDSVPYCLRQCKLLQSLGTVFRLCLFTIKNTFINNKKAILFGGGEALFYRNKSVRT